MNQFKIYLLRNSVVFPFLHSRKSENRISIAIKIKTKHIYYNSTITEDGMKEPACWYQYRVPYRIEILRTEGITVLQSTEIPQQQLF